MIRLTIVSMARPFPLRRDVAVPGCRYRRTLPRCRVLRASDEAPACCRLDRPHSWIDRQSTRASAKPFPDRKSTRLNSSHVEISYAVFCLKKKKKKKKKKKAKER